MKTSSEKNKDNIENDILEQLYEAYESKMYGVAYSILKKCRPS